MTMPLLQLWRRKNSSVRKKPGSRWLEPSVNLRPNNKGRLEVGPQKNGNEMTKKRDTFCYYHSIFHIHEKNIFFAYLICTYMKLWYLERRVHLSCSLVCSSGFFGTFFWHPGILKVPTFRVFTLSFFLEFWQFFSWFSHTTCNFSHKLQKNWKKCRLLEL